MLANAGLLVTWDLAERPVVTLLWLALASGGLVWAERRLRSAAGVAGAQILLVALLLRLLLLPLPPTLSDDVLRYVWDGKVVAAGLNPYLLPPDDPQLEPLRDALWSALPHRDVPTVYPPVAQGLFSIAARLPFPVLALKTLLMLCDLGVCILLLRLAAAVGLPERRVVWYAWHPLPALEIAGMGHVDALGVAAVVATLLLLRRRPARELAAVATAAVAVLAKLVPLAATPVWARGARRPLRFLAAVLALTAAGLAPLAVAARGVPPGFTRYALSWEFNGPLYEPLWRLSERLEIRARVETRLDELKRRTGEHERWNRLYPYNYPQLHAKLALLGLLAAGLGVVWWRAREPIAGTGAVLGCVLLCSSTVYPWYGLWVLAPAALLAQPAWLLLTLLLPLSYLPQFAAVPLLPWVFLAIWLPFFLLLAWRWRWSTA